MNNELKKKTQEELYRMITEDGNNEIKNCLAKLGSDRIDELFNPEILIQRKKYQKWLMILLKNPYKTIHTII